MEKNKHCFKVNSKIDFQKNTFLLFYMNTFIDVMNPFFFWLNQNRTQYFSLVKDGCLSV